MASPTKKMKLIDAATSNEMDLNKCESNNVHDSTSNLAVQIALNIPEIRATIFNCLNSSEKGKAAQVCRNWRDTSEQLSLWKNATCKVHQGRPIPTDILKRRQVRKYELFNMDSEYLHSTFKELVGNHPYLQSLKLSNGCQLTDNILQDTLPPSGLTGMTTLDLSACVKLTDVGMDVITRTMPNLKSLNLGLCTLLTETAMLYISERLPQLKNLDLRRCPMVTVNGISHLVSRSRPLGESNRNAAPQAGKGLAILTLNLGGCQGVTDEALQHLSNMAGLQTLILSCCTRISDDGMAHLAKIANLKVLKLAFCYRVTDVGLEHLARMSTTLKELNLHNCHKISEVGIDSLAKGKPNITQLDITNCCGIGSDGLLRIASGMCHLEQLSLDYSHITFSGLHLAHRSLPHLNEMHVNGPKGEGGRTYM